MVFLKKKKRKNMRNSRKQNFCLLDKKNHDETLQLNFKSLLTILN